MLLTMLPVIFGFFIFIFLPEYVLERSEIAGGRHRVSGS
jgi:hypothetical protein